MLTKKLVKQKFIHFALLLGAVLVLLSACDSGNNPNGSAAATPTSATVNSASAIVRHTPSGTVELMWDHTSHVLTVHMALTGLTPKSTHPAHINTGSCKNGGKLVYNLSSVKATQIGFADVITRVKDVTGGIPETGWYIDVSNGPSMDSSAQAMPITCSNVFNPTVSTKLSQNVQATMANAFAPNQSASGDAQLTVNNNSLTVALNLKGLAPNSKHMAHIHIGSCASQGAIKYTLKPVVANAAGDGISTTIIPNISTIPRNGWYINIHQGATSVKSQTDNDPFACGDITSLH
ncbi:CHRD domain-containing protein [Dictyobacter aurantiacus]|uniref:CHRD domain-containing protein n=1 Tax=Dictyobacter aurantiacus TaxID=1936993 RepID=A0A401ZA91_9CHLR|nr:CHRD domain-containing protein [Dictyobacter aurantiacus]GCE03791.1 hypothetical protein KDAU_11200 [Dictyobacter aurantiacus]